MRKRIASLVMVLLVCVNLSACGTKPPKDAANEFLSALQKMDDKTAGKLYNGDFKKPDLNFMDDKEMDKAFGKLLENKVYGFDYTINGETITDNKATVQVEITAYNIGDAMTKSIQDYLSKALEKVFSNIDLNQDKDKLDNEMSKILTQTMKENLNKCKKDFKKNIKINLTKVDGEWKVDNFKSNQDFVNAISGDMTSAINQISKLGTDK